MDEREALKSLIQGIPGKTLAAKLRTIMPEIDRRVREGVQHQEIIDALNEQGFDINLNTFRSYLYRYRKKVSQEGGKEVDCTNQGLRNPEAEPPEPASTTDGNSSVEDSGEEIPQDDDAQTSSFDDLFDSQKRDAFSDKYMSQRRPISTKRSKD